MSYHSPSKQNPVRENLLSNSVKRKIYDGLSNITFTSSQYKNKRNGKNILKNMKLIRQNSKNIKIYTFATLLIVLYIFIMHYVCLSEPKKSTLYPDSCRFFLNKYFYMKILTF